MASGASPENFAYFMPNCTKKWKIHILSCLFGGPSKLGARGAPTLSDGPGAGHGELKLAVPGGCCLFRWVLTVLCGKSLNNPELYL